MAVGNTDRYSTKEQKLLVELQEQGVNLGNIQFWDRMQLDQKRPPPVPEQE